MKTIKFLMISLFILQLGCTTPKKAKLESSDPNEVVTNLKILRESLLESNSNLLAKKSFESGDEEFRRAQDGIKENWPRDKVLDTLAQSKAHYLDSKRITRIRKSIPTNILAARKETVKTDIYSNKLLTEKLSKLDDSLIVETNSFMDELTTKELSNFQKKYQDLTVEAIQESNLGSLKAIVKAAERKKAKVLAPVSLKNAKEEINYAENLISQSPQNSYHFSESVKVASKAVNLLDDVMMKLTGSAKGSNEPVALELVYQERKLQDQTDEIGYLQSSLSRADEEVDQTSIELADTEDQLETSESKIRLQKALDEARKSFFSNEADIYQQGDDLIIRLKKISFKTGSAMVPSKSMMLLSKVNSIITKLNPSQVQIEGHTDSSGPEASNLLLSTKRAKAVKKYLASLKAPYNLDARGFGESKPIANNQTKSGRALNRRVDIVVKGTQ